ncbi:hypothetical protein A3K78_06500 [Candidatus Bathyarchaeota archaeon RBG_13_52_12]|nr:MAG: hypothetical protein A3K78_06500 [Candidatus Bathyarchaeota archaeon RBG_13_52_12]
MFQISKTLTQVQARHVHQRDTGRSKPVGFRLLTELLLSERLVVRFAALFTLETATFLIFQTIGYLWLPEGLLRDVNIGSVVVGNEAASSFFIEFARIFAWNLSVLGLFYMALNLLRFANGIPWGYMTTVTLPAFLGVITGTNSFSMATVVGKIASALEMVTHPGFYEIFAMVLAAAATYEITRWQFVTVGGKESIVKFQPTHGGWRSRDLWIGLVVAVGILLAANAWEAQLILAL